MTSERNLFFLTAVDLFAGNVAADRSLSENCLDHCICTLLGKDLHASGLHQKSLGIHTFHPDPVPVIFHAILVFYFVNISFEYRFTPHISKCDLNRFPNLDLVCKFLKICIFLIIRTVNVKHTS